MINIFFNCGYLLYFNKVNNYYKAIIVNNNNETLTIPLLIFESDIDKCYRLLNDLNNNLNEQVPFNSFYLMVAGAISTALKYVL